MKRTAPILFVWVPLGLKSGAGNEGATLIFRLLVIVVALLLLEKIVARRH